MANSNPNTTGLRPFNQMSHSESAEIHSKGGLASAEKRRQARKIRDIINAVRADYDVDPVEQLVISVFQRALDPTTSLADMLKVMETVRNATGETAESKIPEDKSANKEAALRATLQQYINGLPPSYFDEPDGPVL